MNPFTDTQGQAVTPVFVIGTMGWALGFFGAQHVLQRFMAVEREDRIKPSRNLSTLWLCLVYSLSFLLGLFARPALRRSRDHRTGRGAGVFPGGGALLSRNHRGPAADGGDRGGDEHRGFAIAAVVGHRGREIFRCCAGSPVHSVRRDESGWAAGC